MIQANNTLCREDGCDALMHFYVSASLSFSCSLPFPVRWLSTDHRNTPNTL